ncbi:MAG: hypothetical protein Q8Q37_02210 [bacterium]|nr:hypothetical protein [bacterium]
MSKDGKGGKNNKGKIISISTGAPEVKQHTDLPSNSDYLLGLGPPKMLDDYPFTQLAHDAVVSAGLRNTDSFLRLAAKAAAEKKMEVVATMCDDGTVTHTPPILIAKADFDARQQRLMEKGVGTTETFAVTGVQLTVAETQVLIASFQEKMAAKRASKDELYKPKDDGDRTSCHFCESKFQPKTWNKMSWKNGVAEAVVNRETGEPVRLGNFRAMAIDGVLTKVSVCRNCVGIAKQQPNVDSRTYPSDVVDGFIARQSGRNERLNERGQNIAAAFGERRVTGRPRGIHGGNVANGGAHGRGAARR